LHALALQLASSRNKKKMRLADKHANSKYKKLALRKTVLEFKLQSTYKHGLSNLLVVIVN
jgi:hypothetical protein